MNRSAAALVFFAAMASSRLAPAAPPPIKPFHLAYERSGDDCPDEAAFRKDVALRLGVDPFVANALAADATLVVVVDGKARKATVSLVDAKGQAIGKRVITEPQTSCTELVGNAAFAASVAIDPTVLSRVEEPPKKEEPPPPPPAKEAPPPPAAKAEPDAPEPTPPPTKSVAPRIGALAAFGPLPSPAFGAQAGITLPLGDAALGADLFGMLGTGATETIDDRATAGRTSATLSSWAAGGEIHACYNFSRHGIAPYGCAAGFVGAAHVASSGIAHPSDATLAYLTIGPRLGVLAPIGESMALDLRLDVPFSPLPLEARVDDQAVWKSSVVGAIAGVGLVFARGP